MRLRQSFGLFALTVVFFYQGCRPDSRLEEARILKLDSLRSITVQDSLLEIRLNSSLREPLRLIDEPRLDSVGADCFRLIVVFSWGVSPVGPVMAVRGCSESSGYIFVLHTFPPGEDPNDISQRRRKTEEKTVTRDEFLKISNLLDSIGFERIPMYRNPEYSMTDPSEYYIERYRDGQYHAIVRAAEVDAFVYKLLADASEIVDAAPEMVGGFRRLQAGSK